jgi:hypothetical protein
MVQGCSFGQKHVVPSEGSSAEFVETELIFGLCKNELCASENDFVSEKEWADFLDDYITANFPNGLTVLDSTGQWRNKSGKVIKEKSKIVILVYPDSKKSEESIEQIRKNYKTLFHQESIIKIKRTKVNVAF